jgi:hypothetical protein
MDKVHVRMTLSDILRLDNPHNFSVGPVAELSLRDEGYCTAITRLPLSFTFASQMKRSLWDNSKYSPWPDSFHERSYSGQGSLQK